MQSLEARRKVSIEADPAGSGPGAASTVTGASAAGRRDLTGESAMANGSTSLRAVELTLSFGPRAVLSNISLDVQQGVVTALLGPTGSGKTTLLRTFNRMNDKVTGYRHAGDVLLDGRSIWHPGVELMSLRRKVGMLFQRPNPFPMSIMDNVVAGVRAHRLASRNGLKAIARQRLAEVGLWDAAGDRLKDSPPRPAGSLTGRSSLTRAAWSSTARPSRFSRTLPRRRPLATSAAGSASQRDPPARGGSTPPPPGGRARDGAAGALP